jgi:tRNA-specific 2-thiouridylase
MKSNNTTKKVLLGLSGGVDSSVAALLLKKQGYAVIGCFLKCFSDTKDPITGECGWIKEKQMAQKIASKLEIPFVTLDAEKEYKKEVILPMFNLYKQGKTPNPDISCNKIIKFPWLIKEAKKLNCNYIATGHHARVKKKNDKYYLLKGKDDNKDQSYFLYELDQPTLAKTLFPVGNLTKDQVRKIAKNNKFPNWDKHGTSGICFIGQQNMKSFLEKRIRKKQGIIKDPNNKIIGTHDGIFYYTIGQKAHKSIGIKFQKPIEDNKRWFIAQKQKPNTLIIAPEGHPILKRNKIIINNLHLINDKRKMPSNITARIRHLGALLTGKLIKKGKSYQFTFKQPQSGVAEGQHIVLYNKSICLGGGEISL